MDLNQQQTNLALVYWGDHGMREGWWAEYGKGPIAILGPSICEHSGGGPREAYDTVAEMLPSHFICVEVPPTHSPGIAAIRSVCLDCEAVANRLNSQQFLTMSRAYLTKRGGSALQVMTEDDKAKRIKQLERTNEQWKQLYEGKDETIKDLCKIIDDIKTVLEDFSDPRDTG